MELLMPALIGPGCSCCGNYNFDFCVKFCVAFNVFFLLLVFHMSPYFFKALLYLILCGENAGGISIKNKSAFGQEASLSKESDFFWQVGMSGKNKGL